MKKIFPAVVANVPPPLKDNCDYTRVCIIDSWFDNYLGVVVLVKLISGKLKPKQKIKILSNKKQFIIDKVGVFTPKITYLK